VPLGRQWLDEAGVRPGDCVNAAVPVAARRGTLLVVGLLRESEEFFFEKKNQKTFDC
jgi:hypothetical protein